MSLHINVKDPQKKALSQILKNIADWILETDQKIELRLDLEFIEKEKNP